MIRRYGRDPVIARVEEVWLDAPVLAFTLGLNLLTALAFGAIPWLVAKHQTGEGDEYERECHLSAHQQVTCTVAAATNSC